MPQYRFLPRRPHGIFWATAAVLTAALGLPPLLAATLPPSTNAEVEKVVLSGQMSEWETPIEGLYCEPDPLAATMLGWTCGQASVQAAQNTDVEDSERSLRRAVRAYASFTMPEGPVFEEDGRLALYDAPSSTAALSFPHDDGSEEQIVVITGNPAEIERLAGRIWTAFGPGALPPGFAAELAHAGQETEAA